MSSTPSSTLSDSSDLVSGSDGAGNLSERQGGTEGSARPRNRENPGDGAFRGVPRPVDPGGDRYGTDRVLEPMGALPQPAWRVDNDFSRVFDGEVLLAVETLNIDAASFRQMEEAARARGIPEEGLGAAVGETVLETIRTRGKQHNPVTGSGGMLLGRVLQVTPGFGNRGLTPGQRVATLVSLSLTPLRVDTIRAVRRGSAQLDVEGEAVLFASGPYAVMPTDMSERLALAVLDVAGAAPQVARWVVPGGVVVILGAGGKSGILCAAEARRQVGRDGLVLGVENYGPYAEELRQLNLCDEVLAVDATDPLAVRREVLRATDHREADLTLSCVNGPDAEMSAILVTRHRGRVYFFSMSTSFTKAALGAEGVGKDVDLLVGNGYAEDHANYTLDLLRQCPEVRSLFERRYG